MEQPTPIFTKENLIERLREIKNRGWIPNARPGNVGGIGNTLEDLLGIKENNLPIPNAAEWELKGQRIGTTSLITLKHIEPSPRALKFVPDILLPKYGWRHQEAGIKYPENEMSFRQTISSNTTSDRGFKVVINDKDQRIEISFNASMVALEHSMWLEAVEQRTGLGELNPQPYWGFSDLKSIIGTKLINCFYVQANSKKLEGIEYLQYEKLKILREFSFDNFLDALRKGDVLIDFDARTGHNHGTKIRVRQNKIPDLYHYSQDIIL
ncbi:MvaI/BcnI family restriction endonuclease [Candidatus Chlorohelix sp.]|uniref:MvaI/BcnI family restriction endonuclease n=1 Tax=Candidatus Chlorohelix sp. TaxID=3139201 RepID=UPI00302B3492